eukprot:GHVS01081190.1.p1 GENE.GHVS01081190.1~~GHVS01081190.1.p1  ORF type:complete len:265 (-),score=32.42 GHVS01081190.1:15-809(-)
MMRKHMWDPIGPRWADAVMKSSGETELSRINSAASFVPLWADVPLSSSERCATAEYLFEHAGLVHEHGISATNKHTGHQWDYPNMWLPSAQMALYWAIFGQGKECTIASGNLRDKATTMVTHYLDNAYRALIRSKAGTDKLSDMLYLPEKFDVRIDGGPGGGGEYKNQYGFGWTVGVLIEWIYYRIIDFRMPQNNDFFANSSSGGATTATNGEATTTTVSAVLCVLLLVVGMLILVENRYNFVHSDHIHVHSRHMRCRLLHFLY